MSDLMIDDFDLPTTYVDELKRDMLRGWLQLSTDSGASHHIRLAHIVRWSIHRRPNTPPPSGLYHEDHLRIWLLDGTSVSVREAVQASREDDRDGALIRDLAETLETI